MFSTPTFIVKVYVLFSLEVCLEKRHMEKGKIGIWRQMQQMNVDMKRREQKESSKRGDKQNKFIFMTKHSMMHLKYCCGSTLLVQIVLCVCVCVCVYVCLAQLKPQKGLNKESVLLWLITYFKMSISSCGLKQSVFLRLEKVS